MLLFLYLTSNFFIQIKIKFLVVEVEAVVVIIGAVETVEKSVNPYKPSSFVEISGFFLVENL